MSQTAIAHYSYYIHLNLFPVFCEDVHEVEKEYRIDHSSLTLGRITFHGTKNNGFKNRRSPRTAMEQRQEGIAHKVDVT